MPPARPLGTTYAALIDRLREGWSRVREGTPMEGVDGVSPRMFELRLEDELAVLERELRRRRYRPRPRFAFSIPKPRGGSRRLEVPVVRDRVVQAAALEVLDAIIDAELVEHSFAYRRGRSWRDAVLVVEQLRDEGFTYVVDADIDDYFDQVDHARLLERIGGLVDDDVVRLVRLWIQGESQDSNGLVTKRTRGLPQGALISPVLANLFLDEMDDALAAAGFRVVRYSDDFLVLCRSKPRARRALELTEDVLHEMSLRLDPEKTRLTTFDDGFRFLGTLFIRSLAIKQELATDVDAAPSRRSESTSVGPESPKVISTPERATPRPDSTSEPTALGLALMEAIERQGLDMIEFMSSLETDVAADIGSHFPTALTPAPQTSPTVAAAAHAAHSLSAKLAPGERPFLRTLYVTRNGAWLRYAGGRFVATLGRDEKAVILAVPSILVRQIVIFGSVLITPSAIRHCLTTNVGISILSSRGAYYGKLESDHRIDASRIRLQVLRSMDAEFRLGLAKCFVRGRVGGERVVLRRAMRKYREPELGDAANELARITRRIDRAGDIDTLRGLEGQAAAQYFRVFGSLIRNPEFSFDGRQRRPPPDPVNAMLSFGYTLLYQNAIALLETRKLNPYFGILHSDRHSHAALASDMSEEFRVFIERLVLTLVNRRRLAPSDFEAGSDGKGGCYIVPAARRLFLDSFEQAMRHVTLHTATGRRIPLRRCLDLQVQGLVRALEGTAPYVPFRII